MAGLRRVTGGSLCPPPDDELFSDIYKIREIADGLCLEVEGKVSGAPRGGREAGRPGGQPGWGLRLARRSSCNPPSRLQAEETLFPALGFSRKVEAEPSLEIGPRTQRPSSFRALGDILSLFRISWQCVRLTPGGPRARSFGLPLG